MILSFLLICCLTLHAEKIQPEPVVIEGVTMATTYRIVYFDGLQARYFKDEVDSILTGLNKTISTYDSTSEIAKFNLSVKGIPIGDPYFYDILRKAKKIYKASDGAFDPTVMPLVNIWGFGPGRSFNPSAQLIDSLKQLVGFERIHFSKKRITKSDPRMQIDFGGIGQGYGADVVCEFLRLKGIKNMLVELGGEGASLGKNVQKNKAWTIGILDPNSTPDHQYFKAYATLQDQSFTTSGNYFNYKIINGRKFGHTIDPESGYPVQHSLLSASVFARDCATADAWATAFMVMGIEKALSTLKKLKGIDVLFIFSNEKGELETYVSPRMVKHITFE
jgi:FAD:protein FMN transferase